MQPVCSVWWETKTHHHVLHAFWVIKGCFTIASTWSLAVVMSEKFSQGTEKQLNFELQGWLNCVVLAVTRVDTSMGKDASERLLFWRHERVEVILKKSVSKNWGWPVRTTSKIEAFSAESQKGMVHFKAKLYLLLSVIKTHFGAALRNLRYCISC